MCRRYYNIWYYLFFCTTDRFVIYYNKKYLKLAHSTTVLTYSITLTFVIYRIFVEVVSNVVPPSLQAPRPLPRHHRWVHIRVHVSFEISVWIELLLQVNLEENVGFSFFLQQTKFIYILGIHCKNRASFKIFLKFLIVNFLKMNRCSDWDLNKVNFLQASIFTFINQALKSGGDMRFELVHNWLREGTQKYRSTYLMDK